MKPFWVLLMIGAIGLGIAAFHFLQPSFMEKLSKDAVSASENLVRMSEQIKTLAEVASAIGGERVPGKVYSDLTDSRAKYEDAKRTLESYRKERERKQLLCVGGAAVLFLGSLICFAAPGRKGPSTESPR